MSTAYPFRAVAPNDKLVHGKARVVLRVVVVQVLAAQEEDPAVVEFDEIVRSFVLELLDLERSLRSISFRQKQNLNFELTNTICLFSIALPMIDFL